MPSPSNPSQPASSQSMSPSRSSSALFEHSPSAPVSQFGSRSQSPSGSLQSAAPSQSLSTPSAQFTPGVSSVSVGQSTVSRQSVSPSRSLSKPSSHVASVA